MRKLFRENSVRFYFFSLFSSFSPFAQEAIAFDIVDVAVGSCSIATLPLSDSNIKLMLASHSDAPHYRSDSSSSFCFIEAVFPQYVIFQAGHEHGHPTTSAKDRYLESGVKLHNIFRTDRGDSESSPFDWESDVKSFCNGKAGCDATHIAITANGEIAINYNNPEPSSCS